MGKQYTEITEPLQAFIAKQKIFFVGTAAPEGRVNVSPKGMDSMRVIDANTVAWLNLTGSGNETAAHLLESDRMTIMFCAFEGSPMILRLYGHARAYHQRDAEWPELIGMFPAIPGPRQVIRMNVDLVQSSCGMSVPLYDYVEDRQQLADWAAKKGDEGIEQYWRDNNQVSLDGKPTGVIS